MGGELTKERIHELINDVEALKESNAAKDQEIESLKKQNRGLKAAIKRMNPNRKTGKKGDESWLDKILGFDI